MKFKPRKAVKAKNEASKRVQVSERNPTANKSSIAAGRQ